MSIAKSLGMVDLAAVLCLIFTTQLFPALFIRIIALLLMLKGGIFFIGSRDIVSGADVLAGAYLFFITIHSPVWLISSAAVIFLGQKAIFSLSSQ